LTYILLTSLIILELFSFSLYYLLQYKFRRNKRKHDLQNFIIYLLFGIFFVFNGFNKYVEYSNIILTHEAISIFAICELIINIVLACVLCIFFIKSLINDIKTAK